MANGAEKIINAMKKVNNSNKTSTSEIVTLTVSSVNPLIFKFDNRLEITKEFYSLSKVEDWSSVKIGDTVRAFKMNNAQSYYINELVNGEGSSESVKSLQDKIEDLTKRVEILEGKVGG